jgi:hypothetical protein
MFTLRVEMWRGSGTLKGYAPRKRHTFINFRGYVLIEEFGVRASISSNEVSRAYNVVHRIDWFAAPLRTDLAWLSFSGHRSDSVDGRMTNKTLRPACPISGRSFSI